MISETTKITQNKENKEDKKVLPEKKKKIKCYQCKKKLMLMQQIKCQCNQYFCPCHMNRHSHNCPYNVKDVSKKKIEENNPLMCEKMKDKI